jgi:NAD(P)-dependent dehydrogenase (short-subunit alcohol dehydrogenase family)
VSTKYLEGRVAVVVGGGGGIGSAIALEYSRLGAFVVVIDPGVGVQGEPLGETTAEETARAITAQGGESSASTVSVTDCEGLSSLFHAIVDDHGSLDIVVHAAGILRFASLVNSSQDDWASVFDVHFQGYLNILSCAIPIMATAGRGRIVGLTSGSGLARTSPGNVAYGVAKRALAALTWELGSLLPVGVRINSLSPIAATRMVRAAIQESSARPREVSPNAVDLSAMPQPVDMARAAAFLVRDEAVWSQGQVFFSTGSEHTVIARPHLLECVLADGVSDFTGALATLVPEVFVPAESSQRAGGGSNSRFGEIFSNLTTFEEPTRVQANSLVVSRDGVIPANVVAALSQWGVTSHVFETSSEEAQTTFVDADNALRRLVEEKGHFESIVVIGDTHTTESPVGDAWNHVVKTHSNVRGDVQFHAAWIRAAARLANDSGSSVRIVHVTPALTASGRITSQSVTQLVRNANDFTAVALDAFSISLESLEPKDISSASSLIARLAVARDALALRGTELVAGRSWIGMRSHPSPLITVSTGRADIPLWVNDVFEQRLSGLA